MQKSIRNIAFIAVFTLATTPAMLANPTGTNPRPQGSVVTATGSFTTFVQAVLSFFGA